MMIELGNRRGIIDTPTSVDCGREVRSLRRYSFRSLVECMVPCCAFHEHYPSNSSPPIHDSDDVQVLKPPAAATATATPTVTGTFFGYRKGRVSFCLQHQPRSSPLLLLEFAVPTSFLAREMQHGLLRIALLCERRSSSPSCPLFRVPVWSMYCNGRKVGFAVRRQTSVTDMEVLKLMQSVSVGAGVLPNSGESDTIMYLRATFQRVAGSLDSESFHMINPAGSSAHQELSIFLLRS